MKQVNRHLFEGQAEILLPHIRYFCFFLVLLPKQKNNVQQMMSAIVYKAASERTHCQRKIYSFFFMWHYFYFFLYCSYLQVLILIVSLDLESLRKLIQEDRLVKVKSLLHKMHLNFEQLLECNYIKLLFYSINKLCKASSSSRKGHIRGD